MKLKKIFLMGFFAFCATAVNAQQKTHAFFMLGNYAYSEWEKLEFDLNDHGGEITYSYAKKPDGIKLKNLGIKYVGQYKVLMVQIPGFAKTYYINPDPKNERIQFESSDRKYNKWLPLGYEGPVNGIGTYCEQCANEPKDAFEIVNSFMGN
jgi:hypothetical protein